jgi:hypothetical protein
MMAGEDVKDGRGLLGFGDINGGAMHSPRAGWTTPRRVELVAMMAVQCTRAWAGRAPVRFEL